MIFVTSGNCGARDLGKSTASANLKRIVQGGTSFRILDLYSIHRRFRHKSDHGNLPFFYNRRLNTAFLIKHTARKHERPYLVTDNPVVTKVIVPVTTSDLAMGGHSFFVEERGFEPKLREFIGQDSNELAYSHDLERLRDLAALPSFDPFLLSNRFRDHDSPVADLYFNISDQDLEKMEGYVADQVADMVNLAFNTVDVSPDDDGARKRAIRFARYILAGEEDERFDQLQHALDLDESKYRAAIFGWKGILYYRWRISDEKDALRRFLIAINDLVVTGMTQSERFMIDEIRRDIISETRKRWRSLQTIMAEYETEYGRFATGGDPRAIRHILLKAPEFFAELGHDLSAVSHVTTYWDYWCGRREEETMPARDAMDIFPGFLRSLTRDRGPDEADAQSA